MRQPDSRYQGDGDTCCDGNVGPMRIFEGGSDAIGKQSDGDDARQHSQSGAQEKVLQLDVRRSGYHIDDGKGRHRQIADHGDRENALAGESFAEAIGEKILGRAI